MAASAIVRGCFRPISWEMAGTAAKIKWDRLKEKWQRGHRQSPTENRSHRRGSRARSRSQSDRERRDDDRELQEEQLATLTQQVSYLTRAVHNMAAASAGSSWAPPWAGSGWQYYPPPPPPPAYFGHRPMPAWADDPRSKAGPSWDNRRPDSQWVDRKRRRAEEDRRRKDRGEAKPTRYGTVTMCQACDKNQPGAYCPNSLCRNCCVREGRRCPQHNSGR